MLSTLLEIAQEKSTERRRELLHAVTDLFFIDEESRTDIQIELFDSVLTKLVDEVETPDKIKLSHRLAPSSMAPKGIVMKLAEEEEIEIAAPILSKSPILSNDFLVSVVKRRGEEHMLAISNRQTLESVVTDALIERGSRTVHMAVAKNEGAEFSKDGYLTLGAIGLEDKTLMQALQKRQNKPDINLLEALASEVFTRLDQKNIPITDEVAETVGTRLYEEVADLNAALNIDQKKIEQFLDAIRAGTIPLDGAITALASNDRFMEAGHILASILDMDPQIGIDALINPKTDPFVILSRAAGVSITAFEKLAHLREKRLNRTGEAQKAVSAFNGVEKSVADRVVRFLKVRQVVTKEAS